MPRFILPLATAIAVFAVALLAGSPYDQANAAPVLDSEEQAFVNLINQYRQQNGRSVLGVNNLLADAADWMSADMGAHSYFSHCDLRGLGPAPSPCPNPCSYPCRDPFQRMSDFGYSFNAWKGENIAAGYTTAQAVFDGWKNSPGHNANMLSANYKVMGIARAYTPASPYGWYWTNDFGGYDPGPTPTPSPTPSPTSSPTPSPTPSPSPTPGPTAESDGDGFTNTSETHVGTNASDPCGNPDLSRMGNPSLSWPADLVTVTGPNQIDIQDIASFLAPIRRLGTSPGEPGFDVRWDLVPGKSGSADYLNLLDLSAMTTLSPPMLGGQKAFGGPACPNP